MSESHLAVKAVIMVAAFLLTDLRLDAAPPGADVVESLQTELAGLQQQITELERSPIAEKREGRYLLADVKICAKAVDWMLRHQEFPKDSYIEQAFQAIDLGRSRASRLMEGSPEWPLQIGSSVRGYVSRIDGSVQPYALSLPRGINPKSGDRWPLHVKLHGRANDMNEVNFIARHEGKSLPDGQNWIQLDVYGRGNNAYRWAGETDVFEAIADVRRRFRIDDDRITLHGFSMGGAGAWHLGMHYPAMWSSVGPGAGFIDFYNYQKQTEQRPSWQHETLAIYDSIDYALNAFNVPVCTYGGENDAQLVASTGMVDAAKLLDVDIKLLIGPGMGHKFHPDSFQEFMEFHQQKSEAGRQKGRGRQKIRFTTRSLRYGECDWLTVQEIDSVYEPATVEAELDNSGNVVISTANVAAISISRDVGDNVIIDGDRLPLYDAGEGLLPSVYYVRETDGWRDLAYDESRAFQDNPEMMKRHGLQGPIDDAFMESFVCVRGTAEPLHILHEAWTNWTLDRFESEFDKWMRARVKVIDDSELDDQTIADSHLILFGDPSSNSVIRQVMRGLPIEWDKDVIKVGDRSWNTRDHGLSLIYPNPLNPQKYVVINSGHTFHEPDFLASNSWLFPRLGDIAVQKLQQQTDGGWVEELIWGANFDSGWQLPR